MLCMSRCRAGCQPASSALAKTKRRVANSPLGRWQNEEAGWQPTLQPFRPSQFRAEHVAALGRPHPTAGVVAHMVEVAGDAAVEEVNLVQ